jgi:hypothetical protein
LNQEDILRIESESDYKKLFSQIDAIKNTQPDTIRCAYILTPTEIFIQAKFLIDCDIYQDRKISSSTQIAYF